MTLLGERQIGRRKQSRTFCQISILHRLHRASLVADVCKLHLFLFIVDKNIIHYHVSSVSELTCESNWIEEISYRLTRRIFLSHLSRHAVKNKRLRKKNWDLNSAATFWVRHASIFWRDFELVRLKPLEPMQIQTNFRYFPIMTFDTLALPRSFPIIIATALKIEMLSILHNMDMAGGEILTHKIFICLPVAKNLTLLFTFPYFI